MIKFGLKRAEDAFSGRTFRLRKVKSQKFDRNPYWIKNTTTENGMLFKVTLLLKKTYQLFDARRETSYHPRISNTYVHIYLHYKKHLELLSSFHNEKALIVKKKLTSFGHISFKKPKKRKLNFELFIQALFWRYTTCKAQQT